MRPVYSQDDLDAMLARLTAARDEYDARMHARARPVTCPACVDSRHGACVRPCDCAGERHGRA